METAPDHVQVALTPQLIEAFESWKQLYGTAATRLVHTRIPPSDMTMAAHVAAAAQQARELIERMGQILQRGSTSEAEERDLQRMMANLSSEFAALEGVVDAVMPPIE